MGIKDYARWTEVKRTIQNNRSSSLFVGIKEREVWLCSIGENVGFEEDGKGTDFLRPVLIVKVFNRRFCHIVPLSTTARRGRFYYPFDSRTGKTSVVLLSQSRPVDSARLHEKIGSASVDDFIQIKHQLGSVLGL